MKNTHRWDVVHAFECAQKREYFGKMKPQEKLKIYGELYDFSCALGAAKNCVTVNRAKIEALSKIHKLFMRVQA